MTKNVCFSGCGKKISEHNSTEKLACALKIKRELESTIMTAIIFCFLAIAVPHMAVAEMQTIQIFDGTGQPIILPDQSVAILQINSGTYLHGTVTGTTPVTSSLSNFLSSTSENGITTFSGIMPNYQVQLTIGSKTIILQPTSQDLPFGLSPTDILLVVGIIGAIALAVGVVMKKRANF